MAVDDRVWRGTADDLLGVLELLARRQCSAAVVAVNVDRAAAALRLADPERSATLSAFAALFRDAGDRRLPALDASEALRRWARGGPSPFASPEPEPAAQPEAVPEEQAPPVPEFTGLL